MRFRRCPATVFKPDTELTFLSTRGGSIKKLFLLLVLMSVSVAESAELEPIVVSSKQNHSQRDVLSSVSVYEVNSKDENSAARVIDLLDKIPGLEISKSGLLGGASGIFIRGQESRHTVILIDGAKVYDPTSVSGSFNINTLNIANIDRIEVLKGSQSVLYGSDAIGGVINIITRKGAESGSIKLSGGYYQELAVSKAISSKSSSLWLNGFFQESNFDSEAKDGSEKDTSLNRGMDLRYTKDFGQTIFGTSLKYAKNESEVDEYDYTENQTIDDKTSNSSDELTRVGVNVESEISNTLSLKSQINHSQYVRKIEFLNVSDYETLNYNGEHSEFELRANLRTLTGPIIFGVHSISESYEDDDISKKIITINDFFVNEYIEGRKNFYEIGGRLTSSDHFGSHVVYGLGVGRRLDENYTLKLTNKTGYKAPSVYQLRAGEGSFGPIGNENLAPEKSISRDLSLNYKKEKISLGTSVFYNEVRNFIDFESGAGYVNDSFGIYRGAEFFGEYNGEKYRLDSSLTLLNISLSSGEQAQRRPDFSYALGLSNKFNDYHSFGIDWNWSGRRFERIGGETFRLSPYDVLDINYSFMKGRTEVLASVQNILDREYEIGRGYSVLRRALEVTVIYKF